MNMTTRLLAVELAAQARARRARFEALLADERVSWAEIDAADPTPAYVRRIKESARLYSLDLSLIHI